jgi:hypothetical protein
VSFSIFAFHICPLWARFNYSRIAVPFELLEAFAGEVVEGGADGSGLRPDEGADEGVFVGAAVDVDVEALGEEEEFVSREVGEEVQGGGHGGSGRVQHRTYVR